MASKRKIPAGEGGGTEDATQRPDDAPQATPSTRSGVSALQSLETLEAAYALWLERRLEHAAERTRLAEERARLDDQATFILNTVRAADPAGAATLRETEALVAKAASGLGGFVAEAERSLAEARRALEARTAALEARHAAELEALQATILERVTRRLAQARPRFRVVLRKAGPDRRILHVERLGPDEAVVALHALTGKLPSRYGFLFDDATEDVHQAPPALYAEEGVSPAEVRPGAAALRARVEAPGRVLPVKGLLPLTVRRPDGAPLFARLLQRGPVMEAELQDGDGFRNLLTPAEAEQVAGELLRLKLEGRLELELSMG